MSNLINYNFNGDQVRLVMVESEPWFIAADVCASLNIDSSQTRKLDDDEKALYSIQTLGGKQDVAILSESGVYTLTLRCRDAMKKGTKPYRFRKWVTGEVLPSVRKTGGYSVDSFNIPKSLPEALRLAADLEEQNQQLQLENKEKSQKIESLESLFQQGETIPQFCKKLNGVNVMQVCTYLEGRNWLYNESKSGVRWRVKSYARDKYLTEEGTVIDKQGQEPFIVNTPILLKNGAVKLYDYYIKGMLPMKKTWNGEYTQDKELRGAA